MLVELLEPYKGRVYDPCCGSGGMFVQSEKFIAAHGGNPNDISVFGQESNPTTWRLCKLNLAIRGIEANLGAQWGDTFRNEQHKGLKADFVVANPPFNISDWGGEALREDVRWQGYRAKIEKHARELQDEVRKGSDKMGTLLKKARSTLKALNVELEAEEVTLVLPGSSMDEARQALEPLMAEELEVAE